MDVKRVAVVGASGFVGSTLVERLSGRDGIEVVPLIHSTGNAWRLTRRAIPLEVVDLLDAAQIANAIRGCTHVVNCSRGGEEVMLTGLRNLLAESRKSKVRGFVHLSSVAVYGDPPAAGSESEQAPTEPSKGSYGWIKLEQDQAVKAAAGAGLPGILLCPPNIGGPYSVYLSEIVAAIGSGELALIDSGATVCNLVDVENLCHAIELSLDRCSSDAPRLFVTDGEDITWGGVVEQLQPLFGSPPPLPSIDRDGLRRMAASVPAKPASLSRSLLHLVSSDVREALRRDPVWARIDTALRRSAAALGPIVEDRLRMTVEGPMKVAKVRFGPRINVRLSAQQLRGIRHSCARAQSVIGYRPIHSFAGSMSAFRKWYRASAGMDNEPEWNLLRLLYGWSGAFATPTAHLWSGSRQSTSASST